MALDRLPRRLLRVEGLAVLVGAITVYFDNDYSVLALVLLFLAPDISFLGYLAGPRAGSVVYNAVHTYVAPLTLAIVGVIAGADIPVQVALIWSAHIGMDRALGYGLKYPAAFEDTHLHRV